MSPDRCCTEDDSRADVDLCACLPHPQAGEPLPPLQLDLWEDEGELVGLSWTAVVSCKVCSLVSISKAAVRICISPHFSPLLPPSAMWVLDLLATQQATKKAAATSKRRGPTMMVMFPVPKANTPTRVTLMPVSMMHRPQAQQREGEGRLWWKEGGVEVCSGFTMSDAEICEMIRYQSQHDTLHKEKYIMSTNIKKKSCQQCL